MKLFFITGASCSGKTTLLKELKKNKTLSLNLYDFDDIGVPENADKRWRQQATEQWLQRLLQEGKNACLFGQMVIGEILACPSAQKIPLLHICSLDVSNIERVRRLKQRNTYGIDQSMLSWSAWLGMHHEDPQWAQHVIKEESWEHLNFSRWDMLTRWDSLATTFRLDTTYLSLSNTVSALTQWIHTPTTKPTVIFLNGPSSSGKTSLARLLQSKLQKPYLHIGIDTLIGMMPEKLNNWQGQKVPHGFWWNVSYDEQGNPLAHIQLESYAQHISDTLKEVALTLLNSGHNLIIDEVCVTSESYRQWQHNLSRFHTLFVGITCPTEVLEAREKSRNDRMIGSARAQNLMVHATTTYDLMLDTHELSLEECTEKIITKLKQ